MEPRKQDFRHTERSKYLNSARFAFIIAFLVMVIQAGWEYYYYLEGYADEMSRNYTKDFLKTGDVNWGQVKVFENLIRQEAIARGSFFCVSLASASVIFLILAILVRTYPFLCTVAGLVLYFGFILIVPALLTISQRFTSINFYTWGDNLFFLIVIGLCLLRGITSAMASPQAKSTPGNPA